MDTITAILIGMQLGQWITLWLIWRAIKSSRPRSIKHRSA
jgi:hypothetical protein